MHSFINVFGLCLGMAVTILIGLWMYTELSFIKNFDNYDRIAQVIQNQNNNGETDTWTNTPFPLANVLRSSYRGDFKKVVLAAGIKPDCIVTGDKKKLKQKGSFFEAGAPDMFKLQMLGGDRNSLKAPSSVIISASAAKAFFGDADPINKLVRVDKMPPLKVTGVYKDFPANCSFAGFNFMSTWDFFYANTQWLKTIIDPWRPNVAQLSLLLNDHADIPCINAKIKNE